MDGSSRRALWSGVALAVLAVVAAGAAGTTRFSGPRWVPHWSTRPGAARAGRGVSPGARVPVATAARTSVRVPLAPVLWVLAGLALLGAALVLWRLWSRRSSRPARDVHAAAVAAARDAPPEPAPEPEPERILTGIELALEALDGERHPTDAVVRAWLGLEQTAAESGVVRRPSETPTELTERILGRVFSDDRAVRTLLRLYLRTRFGDHPVTAWEVAAVRGALGELVRSRHGAERSPSAAR